MSGAFGARVGAILSADIAVPEHRRERRFYSRVLTTGDDPLWRTDLLNNLGIPIIGLGERGADPDGPYASLPLQWMPHIQVADVAASVQRATERGGITLMHATDDGGASQWAVLLDPNGAAFGVIPVISEAELPSSDAATTDEPRFGRIAWVDLTVAAADATRDFYREVVGWSVEDVALEDAGERYADYNMLDAVGTPAAGICHARGDNADLPPVWLLYLPVGDIEESLRRVEEEGGTILKATRTDDGNPGYAVVRDPVGVGFALVAE